MFKFPQAKLKNFELDQIDLYFPDRWPKVWNCLLFAGSVHRSVVTVFTVLDT